MNLMVLVYYNWHLAFNRFWKVSFSWIVLLRNNYTVSLITYLVGLSSTSWSLLILLVLFYYFTSKLIWNILILSTLCTSFIIVPWINVSSHSRIKWKSTLSRFFALCWSFRPSKCLSAGNGMPTLYLSEFHKCKFEVVEYDLAREIMCR